MARITVHLARGRNSPNAARPSAGVAHRLRREGRLDEAEKIYRACIAADRRDREAWIGHAALCTAQGRLDDAVVDLSRVVDLDPRNRSLLLHLAGLLTFKRDLAAAARVLSRLIALAPDDFQAYSYKSAVEREQGLVARSRQTLLDGIRRNPFSVTPSFLPPERRVLHMQGLHNSYTRLRWGERSASVTLHLGNFNTEHLWSNRRIATITCRVTGDGIPGEAALPPYDIVVNAIADPDVEAESLHRVAEFLDRHPEAPVINHPRFVLETTRDGNYRRLKDRPGIVFPKTVRMTRADGSDVAGFAARHGLSFPIILRVPGSHTGRTTVRADDAAAAQAYLGEREESEFYVIAFADSRFRGEFYRKMRIFFIDGEPYPVVHHIDRIWNVHGGNRRTVMAATPWMTEMEQRFIDDPAAFLGGEIMARLRSLHELVRLEFFGVDFTVTDGGDLLIYEMNPAMRHSFEHAVAFPYLRPSLRRITNAFQAMIETRSRRK